jgi:branched-subunit amino acid transport protein
LNLLYVVLAMGAVTYIPRMLPLVLLKDIKLPRYINSFMKYIPFAALGALIFPGVLTSTGPDNLGAAIAGCFLSIVLAFFEINLILVVAGGIIGAFIVSVLF